MRALLQRVSRARVTVEAELVGEIAEGLLILVCAMQGDTEADADRLADKALIVGESNDRRRCARAFGVFNYTRLAAIHDRNAAVGRSKVDTDDFGHCTKILS